MAKTTSSVQIGVRLRLIRKTNFLNQKDLADILDCSQATIVKIESGELLLNTNHFDILLNKLAVNPMFLLGYSKSIYLENPKEIDVDKIGRLAHSPKLDLKVKQITKQNG